MSAEIRPLVASHPFAADLSDAQLDAICRSATILRVAPGARLFAEGGEADRCYLLLDGTIGLELHLPGRGATTAATIGPGDLLGWSWLVPPHRWRFDATARTDARLVALDAEVVRAACADDPDLDRALHRTMAATLASRLEASRHQLLDLYRHGSG